MKKVLIFTVMAALVAAANIGCDVDANLDGRKLVIDRISVEPDDWKIARTGDSFDHFYYDVRVPEITDETFGMKVFNTYLRTKEMRDGEWVDVQTHLPVVTHLNRYEDNVWKDYTETIKCKYEIGYVRITISRSPSYDARPTETFHFRTVISY